MELKELIDRVKAAIGPDRELDADIYLVLLGGEVQWRQANYTMEMYPVARRLSANHVVGYEHEQVPCLTASIDAALALMERCLPGWGVETTRPAGGAYGSARIYPGTSFEANGKQTAFGKSATVPLAIILALLTALDQKEENK